ncbi:MAG: uroporphyrinogen-III synthase, partial [Woeseiaceae bacterium]|nr:uroporphyrinogen-III synthase [Woeseiaceae bacterium]
GFDSEHLLATQALRDVAGQVVRIVRGRRGRELLGDTLRDRGAAVEYLAVYERIVPKPTPAELERLESLWVDGGIAAVVVMSVESLDNLVQLLPDTCRQQLPVTRLVTPAPRVIKEALTRFPGIPTTLAASPGADDLAKAVIDAVS